MAFSFLKDALHQRQQQGLLRQEQCVERYDAQHIVIGGKRYLNFSSNDYLGLASLPTPDALHHLPKGSGGSPLVTGFSYHHQALCDYLATSLKREAVLLLGAGFSANKAIMSVLGSQKGMRIVADKLAHASIIDGGLASDATFKRFRHNDVAHCEKLMQAENTSPSAVLDTEKVEENRGNRTNYTLVVTESVFSMDGDKAPVPALSALCQENQAALCVDDAHGFGVLGQQGFGVTELHDLPQSNLPILMGTFGKAIGTGGAFIAGSQALIDYLRNFSRDYIYSTAFSPFHAALTLHHLKQCRQDAWRREKLAENIAVFKNEMATIHAGQVSLLPSDTAIQPVIIGEPEKALTVATLLRESGFWVTAIRQPTVPKGTDRLRITLTASHQASDIVALVNQIKAICTA